MQSKSCVFVFIVISAFYHQAALGLRFSDGFESPPVLVAFNQGVVKFTADMSEAQIAATGAARVTNGMTSVFVGTRQAASINQNPIVASFTDGALDWVVADYETGGPDGRGVGVLWDQQGSLYVAFTVDGGGSGLETHTASGWQTGYGTGGGAKVTVVLKLDVTTGQPTAGTFAIARLMSGNTNTVVPVDMDLVDDQLVLFADSFFAPLDVQRNRMTQTGSESSPFLYRVVLPADLGTAISAEAIGWDGVTAFSPLGGN